MKPIIFSTPMVRAILDGRKTQTRRIIKASSCTDFPIDKAMCKVGETLWVRETFTQENKVYWYKADVPNDKSAFFPSKWKPSIHMPYEAARIFLKVTNIRVERLQDISDEDAKAEGVEYIPQMASPQNWKDYSDELAPPLRSPQHSFISLWDKINGTESWEENPFVWVIHFELIAICQEQYEDYAISMMEAIDAHSCNFTCDSEGVYSCDVCGKRSEYYNYRSDNI